MGNSLRWEASWSVDWISVNGETDGNAEGMGDGIVPIGITHASSESEETATTITFTYYDDETGEEVGRKSVDICRCIVCGCYAFEILGYSICSCSFFEIDTSPLTFFWDDDDSNAQVISFTKDECIKDINAVVDNVEWFSVITNNDNITVYSNKKNYDSYAKEGTITISYKSENKPCDEKTINLIKEPLPCSCNNFEILGGNLCTCQDLILDKTELQEWEWNDKTTQQFINIDILNSCVPFENLSIAITGTNKNDFNVISAITEDNKIKLTASTRNFNTLDVDLEAAIEIKYKLIANHSCPSIKIQLKQKRMECNCDNFEIVGYE